MSVFVTNAVHDLTSTHHQRKLAHHIDSCTTLLLHVTNGLHFPSTIALITQLSPITQCTDYTAEFHQTRCISLGLPPSHRRVLSAFISLIVIVTLRSHSMFSEVKSSLTLFIVCFICVLILAWFISSRLVCQPPALDLLSVWINPFLAVSDSVCALREFLLTFWIISLV